MSIANKIEELVYAGMVIDDHGKWISIAEKREKERVFLSHLEQGQVLTNGKWISIADKAATPASPESVTSPSEEASDVHDETTLDPPPVSPEETVYLTTEEYTPAKDQSPEEITDSSTTQATDETVSFPTGHLRTISSESPTDVNTSDAPEYPPETKSMFVEPAPPPETTQSLGMEFEETVLYNIKVLQNTPAASNNSVKSLNSTNKPSTPRTPFKPMYHPHSGFPRTILSLAAIIIVIFIVLLKMYC